MSATCSQKPNERNTLPEAKPGFPRHPGITHNDIIHKIRRKKYFLKKSSVVTDSRRGATICGRARVWARVGSTSEASKDVAGGTARTESMLRQRGNEQAVGERSPWAACESYRPGWSPLEHARSSSLSMVELRFYMSNPRSTLSTERVSTR